MVYLKSFNCYLQGLATVCGAGDAKARHGIAIYIYACNSSMEDK